MAPFDPYNFTLKTKNYPEQLPAYIEVSAGSRNKYEWDQEIGILMLDRVLHSAVHYPNDYGFIPQTLCGDGDPLDVLVIGTAPLMPGCVVHCRPICHLLMEDEKGMDEKVLAVLSNDPHYEEYQAMRDIPTHKLREVSAFFETYKQLESKKWAKVLGWKGTAETHQLVEESHKNYLRALKESHGERLKRGPSAARASVDFGTTDASASAAKE